MARSDLASAGRSEQAADRAHVNSLLAQLDRSIGTIEPPIASLEASLPRRPARHGARPALRTGPGFGIGDRLGIGNRLAAGNILNGRTLKLVTTNPYGASKFDTVPYGASELDTQPYGTSDLGQPGESGYLGNGATLRTF